MRAWKSIEVEFNMNANEYCHSLANLKTIYKNMKRRAKDTVAIMKKDKSETGGGKRRVQEENISSVDLELIDMLGSRATGLLTKFCDDER